MFSRSAFRLARVPAAQRLYSTTPTPPLLLKIRYIGIFPWSVYRLTDLKDAMRNKDTNKLNVLRSLLAEVMNASKTANPPSTDLHILSLINKTRVKSIGSVAEFKAAGREDLAENEANQIVILDSYASQVERVGQEEILKAVNMIVEGGSKSIGDVMKAVMKEFEGKPVVKADVAALVKEALGK